MVLQPLVWNVMAAVLILVGALVGGTVLLVLWILAVLTETVAPQVAARTPLRRLDGGPAFHLAPGHFVERHGSMLIIVLGESVRAIGVGASSGVSAIGVAQIGFAAVSLALAASLHWAYFGSHQDEAQEALTAAPPERQQSVAPWPFGDALAVVLLGVVFAASGLHHALEKPAARLETTSAAQLAGGVAAFWVGLAGFRVAVGRRDVGLRLVGGLALVAATVIGAQVSGFVELVALLAGSVAILLIERARHTSPAASRPAR
ncbi:low temperature requirement protein A [Lapillicoccus sp.]|uniref:low temperature requirement protein A n=1 Tax=Lapillicoccus sp. TaxID=1909287 RepID=UPI0039833933